MFKAQVIVVIPYSVKHHQRLFRGRSTASYRFAFYSLVNVVPEANQGVDCIYKDLSEALDTVNIDRLVCKHGRDKYW